MRFKATDVYDYYRPSKCERRVALRARGEPEQETDTAFAELLRRLGSVHERGHLATLPGVVDLSPPRDPEERERRTLEAIRDGAPAVFQSRFRTEIVLDGETCELVGEPDFLIRDPASGGYFIRDSKLARNINSDRHLAIPLQLQIYGFLYERAVGQRPFGLQVHAGTGEIVLVPYDGEAAILAALSEHRRMQLASPDGYEPVGWTKCKGCGFEDRCWGLAKAAGDVALLTAVSQKRARELHARGISTIRDIASAIEDPAHRDYFWTGKKKPHLKVFVPTLLRSADSYLSNTTLTLGSPDLPDARNFAVLDLEGLPPYMDDLERIYLWGVKVFGDKPSAYLPAQAGFGPDGDREGWFAFLALAGRLFAEYGPDLRFVHWSNYEKTKINLYVERYGDPSGIAVRVLANLVDLLAVVRDSVVLPLPSYSLKVVEDFVGFKRSDKNANGSWSIAKYIEATETNDPAARDGIVGEILAYNEEDLDATWTVIGWLRSRGSMTS
ncbi:MAG: TM0106 family RecB-like putative nuclease [Thermoanaerobaculia bacterium]